MKKPLIAMLASVSVFASLVYPAFLDGSVDINPATSVTFSPSEAIDWAIWNTTSSTAVASVSATNTQSGGDGLISAITPFATTVVATNFVRGVGGATQTFSYTDGTSPASQTNATLGFVANSTLATAGRGVQVSISGNASQQYRVDVWTVGFAGQGEMRASLNNASSVTLTSELFGTNGTNKASNLFTFFFTPDSASDLLNLSLHLRANDIGANGHVGIQAITVAAVPEPATCALLLGGAGLGFAAVRRRRRG